MKKYILAILLCAAPCLAGMGIGVTPWPGPGAVIIASAPASASSDTFTDTNGVALTSHTSDSSHTWAKYSTGTAATLEIQSGVLRWLSTSGNSRTVYYSSWLPTDADYSVFAKVYTTASTSNSNYVCGRINTATAASVCAIYAGSSGWTLYDTATQIGSAYVGDIPTTATSIELRLSGTSAKLFIGGTERISATTSVTATGRAGFATYYPDNASTTYTDDWSVTD